MIFVSRGAWRGLGCRSGSALLEGAGVIQIGARYEHGLMTIADSDGAKLLLGDAKNACAQLYIAVGMP